MNNDRKKAALDYHALPRPGKTGITVTKPCQNQEELALAYTPGVAEPVRAIEQNPQSIYSYTNKGNLVAVISDGTAVLGLGNTGAASSKPVMEGKAVLFKRFADIDVFDIEVNARDPDHLVDVVESIAPTFGGINLEDIAAPACFYVERVLSERLDIPVFHDDQHGTAIIISAALLNALEVQGKTIQQAKIVCLGAGAAGVASMRLLHVLGARKENIRLVDRRGVVYAERDDLNAFKREFAVTTSERSLLDAMHDADVFIGVSGASLVSDAMVKAMAAKPVLFALANPDPEILPEQVRALRSDHIMATGRTDYPNQVNNVLGFPFIFRGALDVRAKTINQAMHIAAVKGLAKLARESVPESVLQAYKLSALEFGPNYIIPKPFDPRLRDFVAQAVAKAAMESGVARV